MGQALAQPLAQPLAFIYDRAVSRTVQSRNALTTRLRECAEFARSEGWDIAGWYCDSGDLAFTGAHHPALDRAMLALRQHWDNGRGAELILLVHHWDRLSADLRAQATVIRLVRLSGGRTQTVTAGDDTVPAAGRVRGPVVGLSDCESLLPVRPWRIRTPVLADNRGGYGQDGVRGRRSR